MITVMTGKWIRCSCRFQSHLCSSCICVLKYAYTGTLKQYCEGFEISRNFVEFDEYRLYRNFIRSRFLNRRIADWNLILVTATTTSSFFSEVCLTWRDCYCYFHILQFLVFLPIANIPTRFVKTRSKSHDRDR